MTIDWFTTIAQVINFLVLLAILKFLLFDRIIAAIDEREAKLNSAQEGASAAQEEASAEKERARAMRKEIETTRDERLREAREAADEHRNELESKARDEAERVRERFRASLRDEQRQLISQLVRTAAEGVTSVARHALEDLADADIEGRAVRRLCDKLSRSSSQERQSLLEAWGQLDEPLVVQSSRELSKKERKLLEDALGTAMSTESAGGLRVALDYQVSDKLACGVEISGAGYTVGWSIRAYLAAVEERIQDELSEEASRESSEAQQEAAEAELGSRKNESNEKSSSAELVDDYDAADKRSGRERHVHAQS